MLFRRLEDPLLAHGRADSVGQFARDFLILESPTDVPPGPADPHDLHPGELLFIVGDLEQHGFRLLLAVSLLLSVPVV